MKPTRFLSIILALGLGLTLTIAVFELVGLAAPGNPIPDPPPNSHTAPLTTSVSITYDEPISPATVTSHTFAVHAMQSGLVTATHSVSGGTIVVTPTRPFHQGELVYAIATTHTLSITGTGPLSSTQWQFRAGQLINRDFGRFRDIKAGLYGVYVGSVAWGDYDNDGDLDILLTGQSEITMPFSLIYRNDGGSFTDVGIWLTGVRYGSSVWGDYDNDGDLDILLTGKDDGETPISLIYRNDAGVFTDIGAGLPGVYVSSVAWGDYDNDGDLDILLTGKNDGETPISLIYRNDAGVFTDIGAGLPGVCIGSVAWGDYDNNGDLDILLTGDDGGGPLSLVFRNDGGVFTDIGAGLLGVYGSSVAWGDYDDDGDLDILLTGDYGEGPVSMVYRNDAGVFTYYVDIWLTGVRWGSSAWGDYDNDGDLDILLTGFDASWSPLSLVYRNDGGAFTDIGAGLPGVCVSSVAWGDYDNDGDLDILLSGENGGDPISRIYRNEDHVSDPVLVKTLTPEIAAAGDNITYTLTFFNDGSLTATHVIITDSIPVSVTDTSVVSSGVAITQTSPGYVWQVQNLTPGQGGIITITGVVSPGLMTDTLVANTATITSSTPDADLANNSDVATLTVTVPHLPRLSISKSGPATALAGDPITYTLTITNSGTAPAANPVITDVIPAHAYYVTGGTRVGGVISWGVDSLEAFNGTTQVTFSVTATQVITNSDYRVSADGGYSATGSIPISTVIQPVESGTSLYLPLILRE